MESQKTALSNRFWLGASLVLIIGIALRQLWLGEASFHPDEAIHAHFSGGFGDYHYNPTFHGPLLYHLVASVFGIGDVVGRPFGLGGQNDFSARLIPSLLGIGLLALVIGPLRAWIGNRGALAAAALLAVSPSLVTYSRRLLHDSPALFLTLGAVVCFLTALEHGANTPRGRNARIGVAAFLTLFLCTKANCFFIAAMLGAFYFAWRLAGCIRLPAGFLRLIPGALFAVVTAVFIAFPTPGVNVTGTDGKPVWIEDPNHRVLQIVAILSCAAFGFWLLTRESGAEEVERKRNWRLSSDATTYILALAAVLWLYVFFFGQIAQVLAQWGQTHQFPRETFFEGARNARDAIPRMWEYWGGQQRKPRLSGRHDYYVVLALLYEIPVLLAALGGIWHASKNRSAFGDLLLWWAFSSWTIYALANEKVPWLLGHSVLPLVLLGGLWLGNLKWQKTPLAFATALGFLVSMRGVSGANFERAGDNVEPILYAQTPESFRDLLLQTLHQTRGDERIVWMAGDETLGNRQWPSVWYLRPGAPEMGKSGSTIAGNIYPTEFRAAISNEPQWQAFADAGWTGRTVNFLIWPRASWEAIAPNRYARWFWTRETIPAFERDLPKEKWKVSILSGKGEWFYGTAVIGKPPKK